jgi:hypothetical protein
VALSDDEAATLTRLRGALTHCRRDLELLDAYYEGMQRLETFGMAVPPDLRRFVTVVNWPRIAADAIEERLDLTGFRLATSPEDDADLWRIWQANDLDEEAQLAHLDALVFGRSYATVGSNEADAGAPLIAVESPLEMIAERDPRTREVTSAARVVGGVSTVATVPVSGQSPVSATLYLPDATVWLTGSSQGTRWVEEDRDEHRLGAVPVVPLVNRGRLTQRNGVSEIADVLPLTDAAARALTNAQVATEVAAIPQRWVAGMSKGDFADQNGNPLPAWQAYFGAVWATEAADAKFGQFSAADLGNFTKIVDHYAQLVAGMKGLPVRYFGQNTANPPSADAIRSDEARLVKTCERRQQAWSGSWEMVMRLVRRLIDGDWNPDLMQLETQWRDPATPTRAQAADAAVKLHAEGILPTEAVWEDLGYSAVRREKLREQFQAQRRIRSCRRCCRCRRTRRWVRRRSRRRCRLGRLVPLPLAAERHYAYQQQVTDAAVRGPRIAWAKVLARGTSTGRGVASPPGSWRSSLRRRSPPRGTPTPTWRQVLAEQGETDDPAGQVQPGGVRRVSPPTGAPRHAAVLSRLRHRQGRPHGRDDPGAGAGPGGPAGDARETTVQDTGRSATEGDRARPTGRRLRPGAHPAVLLPLRDPRRERGTAGRRASSATRAATAA